MDEERLIERLRDRAAEDAKRFRAQFGKSEVPNEKWLDNSFTAALPLVAEARELPTHEVHPRLFAAYREEVLRSLGAATARPDTENDRKDRPGELLQAPTPGEN